MERETVEHAAPGKPAGRPLGSGADGRPASRPGIPRERIMPLETGAWWDEPPRQPGPDALGRTGLAVRTPVFGTSQPAHGASGALRRLAYRVPEHRATRWALLLLADRVDVLQHRLVRGAWLPPAALALLLGYLAVSRGGRTRTRARRSTPRWPA
jgi:hypothetical protein